MPIYEYLIDCKTDGATIYEALLPISKRDEELICPCGCSESGKRVPSTFSVQEGLTAFEKNAGTSKNRKDMGAYMKDQRIKRKQAYSPKTREGSSNELWVGNEVRDGVFKGPSGVKKVEG